ncbi:MAG: acetate--CoA ligase family protein [Candidatus Heimdallarchaeota archaeon]
MRVKDPDIKYLFEPQAIAVIGASHNPNKIGYRIVANILNGEYPGQVYPINPKGGEILGLRVYQSIEEITEEIDVAVIAIPAKIVFEAVKKCAKNGVKFAVIITSGFSEIGNTEEENKLVAYAREHNMRILGPNIFGIYSNKASLNATFGPSDIPPGNIAIISQSGALGIALIGKTKAANMGLSAIISVGNKSDLAEEELLEYLVSDERTKAIMMYIEGIKDGETLDTTLQMATKKKPIVVVKSGRSKRGAIAAASHTGSLAGADEIFSDIMTQCGVLRAESIQEALNWCQVLSTSPLPAGDNCVIITNGGGIGVLATDACEKYGVPLYNDIETMQNIFTEVVPDFGSVKNPIDITGQATFQDYGRTLKAALSSEAIHSIICLGCEVAGFDPELFSTTIETLFSAHKLDKPMVFSFVGGPKIEESIYCLKARGIPIFINVYEAVSTFGALYAHHRNLREYAETGARTSIIEQEIESGTINDILNQVKQKNRQFLLAYEAKELMQAAKIPMPVSSIAQNLDEVVKAARKIGYPVVMKVVSKDIIHKSDVGGVALDLENTDEVIDAYQAIIQNCRSHMPNAIIEGVEVAEMVQVGIETIIGARRDQTFGPIVAFGLGGIYVEVMKDVSFRALPIDRKEAIAMVKQIKSYPLLLGVRGEPQKDIGSVVDTILKLGAILERCESISDIEINPLMVYAQGKGVKAVDVRILLST